MAKILAFAYNFRNKKNPMVFILDSFFAEVSSFAKFLNKGSLNVSEKFLRNLSAPYFS